MWRIPGLLGRALNRCHASNIQGCVHGETEALNPSSLIPLGQNVGSKSYSSQSSGAHSGQNEQKHKKRGNFQFCTGQLPQYTVLNAFSVGATAVIFLHLARQASLYCRTNKPQEDRCSRRSYLEQILSSLYQCSRSSVSNHILSKNVQSSTWSNAQLRSDAALQDVDNSLESASLASSSDNDLLHHLVEQDSCSDVNLGSSHGLDHSSEESTSRPVNELREPKEDHVESLNLAASHLLELTQTSVPTVLNIFGIISARDSADYKSAFHFFQESAETGYNKAQYNTAVCYEKGKGVAKDMTKAAEYYRLAASGGHQLAKYRYARHLLQSISGDTQSALQLLLEAAQAGVKEAQAYLGVFYSKESHFDPEKAAKYFWMAAENGDVQSRYHLGVCYEKGFGVSVSRLEALTHYEKAAKSGHELAQQKLLEMQQLQSPDIFLTDEVKQSSPLTVLVLGTQCGYSAIRVLSLLPPDGKLYAVEEDDSMAESAEEMILVSGFKNNQFKLLCQHPVDAIHTLHSTFDLKKVDLVLMDFQSDGYLQGLKALTELGLFYPGSLILLNNMGPLVRKDFVEHLEKSVHYTVVNGCQTLLKVVYGQSSHKELKVR